MDSIKSKHFLPKTAFASDPESSFVTTCWFHPAWKNLREAGAPPALREWDGQFAEVYILTNKDFNLAAGSEAASGNYLLMPDADLNRAFLVRYGGAMPNWLFPESSGRGLSLAASIAWPPRKI